MKPKLLVALIGLVVAVVWLRASREEAPLTDGSFLAYESSGVITRVTFTSVGGNEFRASLEVVYEDGETVSASGMTGNDETVDKRFRTSDGRIFEVGSLGPIWIPPGEVREGGRAHGTRIDEVRSWDRWSVGVVSVAVGVGGALRGEWYYDVTTGFLVGGTKSTAVSLAGEGQVFTLVGSNISGLGLQ